MSSSFSEPVPLGIIGGTGLYQLDCLEEVARIEVDTPWGKPSSPIVIMKTQSGMPVAFISRHGLHHQFTPTDVPARANIAALKHIGVKAIVAFSAVGSLQEAIKPRDFVVPTQVIDRTKGNRPSSFYGTGFVGHVGFGDPFDTALGDLIAECGHVLKGEDGGPARTLHTRKSTGRDLTVVCMEGPAFSTRAESRLYRSWGGDLINMSCVPESKLAKEAEIDYQMICMSTDYDAWREGEGSVTVETVVGNLRANSANAHALAAAVIPKIEAGIKAGTIGSKLAGSMKYSVSTAPDARDPELKAKLEFLHPGYY